MTSRKVIILQVVLMFCLSVCYSNSHRYVRKNWDNERQNITRKDKVKITVYYETLCPASVDFFNSQLEPAVEKLSSYLDVQLIPYGHASTRSMNDSYRFRCQHGPAECYGNKLHACAVHAMQNTTKSVLLNNCLMQSTVYVQSKGYDYASALNWCGYKLNENLNGVRKCVNNKEGSELLMKHGEQTHKLNPRYVPYILLDDSADEQDRARDNLVSTVCQMLEPKPDACYTRYFYRRRHSLK